MNSTPVRKRVKKLTNRILPSLTIALDYSRSHDHCKIQQKVLNLNKTLYNSEICRDALQDLEKSALRGEGISKPEPKSPIRSPKKTDSLTAKIKSDHSPSPEGTQILKLPKMNFGQHTTYNEENDFMFRHFVNKQAISERPEWSKEFGELNRRYRAMKKVNRAQKGNDTNLKHKRWLSADCDSFDMESGFLVCKKEQQIIQSYENSTKQLKGNNFQTFRDFEDERTDHKKLLENNQKLKEKEIDITRRLHPSSRIDQEESKFYITKYSVLFESSQYSSTATPKHPRDLMRSLNSP